MLWDIFQCQARLPDGTVDANCHDAGTSLDPGKWGSGCRTGRACLEPWVLRMFWRYGKFLCSCVYIACHLTSFDHRNWQMLQRADKLTSARWKAGKCNSWLPTVWIQHDPPVLLWPDSHWHSINQSGWEEEPMEPMVGLCWATGLPFILDTSPCLDCRNWTLKENWAPEAKTSLEREWDRE